MSFEVLKGGQAAAGDVVVVPSAFSRDVFAPKVILTGEQAQIYYARLHALSPDLQRDVQTNPLIAHELGLFAGLIYSPIKK